MPERGVHFAVDGCDLLGVLHEGARDVGVLIVVGGPQTRVGSHRQFVLLARHLAAAGYPVLRFDYRSMGDSAGETRDFERVSDDVRAAVDCLCGAGVKQVVIWGLCDAASVACFYAHTDERVTGVVLVNPWARTTEGAAKARLKHYYVKRLLSLSFWKKVFSGGLRVRESMGGLSDNIGKARATSAGSGTPLPQRMLDGIAKFKGRILLIMSGQDITAAEFGDVVKASKGWQRVLSGDHFERVDFPDANHTFSRREWRDEVAATTARWLAR